MIRYINFQGRHLSACDSIFEKGEVSGKRAHDSEMEISDNLLKRGGAILTLTIPEMIGYIRFGKLRGCNLESPTPLSATLYAERATRGHQHISTPYEILHSTL